jgi:hypothetical protein
VQAKTRRVAQVDPVEALHLPPAPHVGVGGREGGLAPVERQRRVLEAGGVQAIGVAAVVVHVAVEVEVSEQYQRPALGLEAHEELLELPGAHPSVPAPRLKVDHGDGQVGAPGPFGARAQHPLALQAVDATVVAEVLDPRLADAQAPRQRQARVATAGGHEQRRAAQRPAPRPPELLDSHQVVAAAAQVLGEALLALAPVAAQGPGQAPQVHREKIEVHGTTQKG